MNFLPVRSEPAASASGASESDKPSALTPAQLAGLDDPSLLQQCVLEAPLGSSKRRIGLGLSGMYCAACSITIEDALKSVPGVDEVQVQAASQRARILLDPARVKLSDLVQVVQKVGYRAWPDASARAGNERLLERRRLVWRLAVAGFCMMQVMMVTVPQYVAGPHEIPPDIWRLMNWACWVLSLPVMLFSCGPFFSGAWRAAKQKRISMDTPVAIGMAATFLVSSAVTFGNTHHFGESTYFDSLTMFVTFLLAGRWLESRAREKVTQSLESLCVKLPEAVDRAVDPAHDQDWSMAQAESVPLSALKHGDRVRVAAGQAVPGDGQVIWGQTELDESMLTGESRTVSKRVGHMVVAGSVNQGAPIWISIERLGPDTRYQQIVALVQQALTEKPGLARVADRFAGPFLWGVLALAALGALAWQWIDPAKSIWVMVSVLVVTCPCALSLAAPSALLAAAGAMGRNGLLVRRLDAIEAMAAVDEVYFDKTGTLTEGHLFLMEVICAGRTVKPAEIDFVRARTLAALSQHPLSRSLSQAGPLPKEEGGWSEVVEVAGKGIQGRDRQGQVWRLGAEEWVLSEDLARVVHAWPDSARARVWLARQDATDSTSGDDVMGFVFDEVFRADAAQTLAKLAQHHWRCLVLSGDTAARVEAAVMHLGGAKRLEIAQAHASPESKLAIVNQAQQSGRVVAVVGDGINDAPVLAKADVSIVLDAGAALAQSQADLIVLGGRLSAIPLAVGISQRALKVVNQNLIWAAVYNLVCIPLALAGYLPPWLAGAGMAASSLGVVLNSLRLTSK
ncbi:MAG: cation-translocating P-type ATPase [Burkholderiales bacterium]|nr:cation-translocating P-type ATPase [Burkholderiales bacterium]